MIRENDKLKLLFCSDFSETSIEAFRYTVDLAKAKDEELIVLHVLEGVPATGTALSFIKLNVPDAEVKEMTKAMLGKAKTRLESAVHSLLASDPEGLKKVTAIEVMIGNAATEILAASEAYNCDAIVMGTHSKGILPYAILGNTVTNVLRNTKVPILVVPRRKVD